MLPQSGPRVNVAVIGGSGLIGKRHCQHVLASVLTNLIAIVEPSPQARAIAKSFNTALYPSVDALLQSPHKPDAAIVCTPNHTHVAIAAQLVCAGIHILVEKPISNSISDAKALIRLAREHNVGLLVGHHRRFNPYIVAAKRAIDSGTLGHITAVNGVWTTCKPPQYFSGAALRWRGSRSIGGGVMLINFIHEIDLMHYLFGEVTRIHAEKTISRRQPNEPDAAEEGAAITLRFLSGVVGTFIVSDNVPSPHNFEASTGENPILPRSGMDVYRIFGSEATLSFPDMTRWSYEQGKKGWEHEIKRERLQVGHKDIPPFDRQIEHFAKVAKGLEQPNCSGEDGLRAVVVCEAIRRALDEVGQGGTVDISSFESKL